MRSKLDIYRGLSISLYQRLLRHGHRFYEGPSCQDPLPFSVEELEVLVRQDMASGYCYHCGGPLDEVTCSPDHMTALSIGGRTELDNIRIICWPCNKRKGHTLDHEFHQQMSRIRIKNLKERALQKLGRRSLK